MEKRNICLTITQIRSHVNFGNNLREARAKKVRFYFVTLKLHRSTCYVNWAILTGDPVDVTTLLLLEYYQIPSNDDPRLTFDLLCKGQLRFLMHLYGKKLKWWITQKLLRSVI